MLKPRKTAAAKPSPAKTTSSKSAPTRITLSASRDIPLDCLVLAQTNVRRLKAGLSIEELAEDIARRTLLQSLSVRPILDEAGAETGRYDIPAGGRRFRALQLLVQQKRLAKDAPIPCIVRTHGIAEEDSLAENVQRVALHPLDQYRAFATLRDQGLGEEAIAARFFVTPQVVRQRLKLAAASPKLLDLYAADELTLEQLMAFCVSDDHARQEQVWETIQRGWNREPYTIRRMLTEDSATAGDRRAVFVGIDAYEAAGGTVLRDLFQQDRGGWLQDVGLLDRLAREKLEAEAATIRAEGWAWVTVGLDFPYGHTAGLRRLHGEVRALSEAEQASLDALQAEHDALTAAHEEAEELPEAVEARFGELEAAIAAIEDRPLVYDPAEVARAGAFVSIGSDGTLRVERGFVRPEDAVAATDAMDGDGADRSGAAVGPGRAAGIGGGGSGATADTAAGEEDGLRPLPDRLVVELTAHRTLALRDALAANPDTAFLAVLHGLCLSLFQHRTSASCLEITAKCTGFSMQAPGLASTAPERSFEARHAAWARQLPDEPDALWAFLVGLDHDSRMALFAHCAAQTVNAVHEPWQRRPEALARADRLADAVGLDLAATWAPTVETYLGRVSKAHILAAVREACGEAAAQLIDHLKKADMAREAERLAEQHRRHHRELREGHDDLHGQLHEEDDQRVHGGVRGSGLRFGAAALGDAQGGVEMEAGAVARDADEAFGPGEQRADLARDHDQRVGRRGVDDRGGRGRDRSRDAGRDGRHGQGGGRGERAYWRGRLEQSRFEHVRALAHHPGGDPVAPIRIEGGDRREEVRPALSGRVVVVQPPGCECHSPSMYLPLGTSTRSMT